MLTGHGNDRYDYKGKVRYDFSSNIPWENKSGEVLSFLQTRLGAVQNYPDPLASELTGKIAALHGVPKSCVLVTAGSAEAFYLLAHLYEGKTSTVPVPSFAEYEDAARVHRHKLLYGAYTSLRIGKHTDLLWFAYPNNPDGFLLPIPVIEEICAGDRTRIVIIDNAYGDLCTSAGSLIPLHDKYPNLVTVHSLTKTFAIPGLRLGYLIASEDIVDGLQRIRIPWSVNALAQEAGSFILDHYEALKPDAEKLDTESVRLQSELKKIPELAPEPSPANFFLVRMLKGSSPDLKAFLVEKHGILIRDASNFRGLSDRHFRLSVQSPEACAALISGLEDYFSQI